MTIPPEIIERLKLFCEENNLGMTIMGSREFNIHTIILGSRDLGPNEAMLVVASTLLQGIVQGVIYEANNQAVKDEEASKDSKDRVKLN